MQKLIDIFVEQNLAGNRDETSSSLRFLDAQLTERQKQLADAEAKRADFQNRYLGSLPGTGSLTDRMSAARSQMSQVESDLAAAQSSLAAVSGQMAGTSPNVAGAAGSAGPARAAFLLSRASSRKHRQRVIRTGILILSPCAGNWLLPRRRHAMSR